MIDHQNKDIEECKRYIMWKYLEVAQLRAEIQALTKALQDLRSTILIAD